MVNLTGNSRSLRTDLGEPESSRRVMKVRRERCETVIRVDEEKTKSYPRNFPVLFNHASSFKPPVIKIINENTHSRVPDFNFQNMFHAKKIPENVP
jgi:hypothetical protein